MRVVLRARTLVARRADLVIVPQVERSRLFVSETKTSRPVICAWNCPPRAEAVKVPARERGKGEPLAIYYHGSINLDRVPLALIHGARLSGVRL